MRTHTMPPSPDERLAVLESRMDRDDEDREMRRRELDMQLQAIKQALEANAREMARYKGMIGGVSLAISVLWAGVAFFKDAIVSWLSK